MQYIFLCLIMSMTLFASTPQETTAVQETVETEQKTEFVDLSDVAQRATKTLTHLQEIRKNVEEDKKTKEMLPLIQPYVDSLNEFLTAENYENLEYKNERDLQKMQSEIAIYLKQLEEWEVVIEDRIKIYDTNTKLLNNSSTLWSQTHVNSVKENAPEAVLTHITSVIVKIEELSNEVKSKYDNTLINSQIINTNMLKLKDFDLALQKKEEFLRSKIFFQNEAPLFEAISSEEFSFVDFITNIDDVLVEKYKEAYTYVQTNPKERFNFFIAIFFIASFIAYFYYLYIKKRLFVKKSSSEKKSFKFLSRPLSTFLILSILVSSAIFIDKPKAFIDIQLLFLIFPIIWILWVVVDRDLKKYIQVFFFLYIAYTIDKNSVGYAYESRVVMLLINVALLVFLINIFRNNLVRYITYSFVRKLIGTILGVYILALVLSIASDIYGSVLLSNRILDGVFLSLYTSIIFYTIYIILTSYVVILLRRRMSTASNMLELYAQKIENSIRVLIKLWMFGWWLLILTKIVGAYPYIVHFRDEFLALSWQVSDITISVQSIFDFIIIIVATWFIAKATKAILEVEVFARFNLPRGLPTAIITILNYSIVISGTIIAFSSLGVNAQQFALIFGALGVGIGFGLRNIIANFVSGIIMVFERPVQIGDTIEMDKTLGSVQSIGARSSVIKTFDGSEVIVPNADFIAKEITNWTLSDEHRRKTLEFKVATDSDIYKVLEIMKEVVLNHKDVLSDPEPITTFKGFDEYYLRFKVYYWLSDNLILAQSEIAISIYEELQKAGIKMPIPRTQIQRTELE